MFGTAGRIVDATSVLVDYVAAGLSVPVYPAVPQGTDWLGARPTLVVLSAEGGPGPRDVVVQDATIVMEAYAPGRDAAFDLARDVSALIAAMPGVRGGVVVYEASLQFPKYVTHSTRNYPRWVAAGSLSCRMAGT